MPREFRNVLNAHPDAEEIRLRVGIYPSIILGGKEISLCNTVINEGHIIHVLELATEASMHTAFNSLASGYINHKGLRIGVCGQAVIKDGSITGFSNYSSIAVRIPHQIPGIIPAAIISQLETSPGSCLVTGPPGAGKTTAIRELVRIMSEKHIRVSLADERGEISGTYGAVRAFELGPCTDIMCAVPKAQAAIILLRTMNPQIIAMDEITDKDDLDAVYSAAGCGVLLIASAHGNDRRDMLKRNLYKDLFSEGIFKYLLSVNVTAGSRSYALERLDV